MLKIRNMRVEDVETVAKMVALDHNDDTEKGYRDARKHTMDHVKIVPLHCYVVENGEKQVIAAMVLHPQAKFFAIEDFHLKEIQRYKEALALLEAKLLEYLENVKTEVLCCAYALRRLIAH